jgi:hypothetical protein
MTIPNIQLLYGLLETIPGSLILDSATDGLLDTAVLGGSSVAQYPFDVEITSLSVDRGRSKQLDRFTSGSASISFNNFDRSIDPLNTASQYDGVIIPRLRLQILADGESIFNGVVKNWNINYDITNWDTASVSLSDAFTILSNYNFDEDVTPIVENSNDRLQWVLEQFNYGEDYSFGGGEILLGDFPITSGTSAMSYLFNVAQSVIGYLYVDASGVLTLVSPFDRLPVTSVFFSDDGTGLGYRSLNVEYDDELIYNSIVSSTPDGSVVVQDAESIASYDVSTLVLNSLLNDSLLAVENNAVRILIQNALPTVRFNELSVELAGLTEAETAILLRLDLADQVTVRKTFSVGSPSVVDQNLVITKIRHQVSADSHVIVFGLEPSPFYFFFRLDDADYGMLDGVSQIY